MDSLEDGLTGDPLDILDLSKEEVGRMRKKVFKVPKRCPLLKTCESRVVQEVFEAICNSEEWIFCEGAKKEVEKYKLTPREWNLILNLKKRKEK